MSIDELVTQILVEADAKPTVMYGEKSFVHQTPRTVHEMNIRSNVKALIVDFVRNEIIAKV
jgi:hypothetical protein